MTPTKDWRFDVGLDIQGKIRVDAYPAAIPDKRFRGLSRAAMLDLRKKISRALRNFQPPGEGDNNGTPD